MYRGWHRIKTCLIFLKKFEKSKFVFRYYLWSHPVHNQTIYAESLLVVSQIFVCLSYGTASRFKTVLGAVRPKKDSFFADFCLVREKNSKSTDLSVLAQTFEENLAKNPSKVVNSGLSIRLDESHDKFTFVLISIDEEMLKTVAEVLRIPLPIEKIERESRSIVASWKGLVDPFPKDHPFRKYTVRYTFTSVVTAKLHHLKLHRLAVGRKNSFRWKFVK